MRRKLRSLGGLLLLVLGGLGLWRDSAEAALWVRLRFRGAEAAGRVTRCDFVPASGTVADYEIEYAFRLPDGREVVGHFSDTACRVEAPVPVRYLPADPEISRPASELALVPVGTLVVAVLCSALSLAGVALVLAAFRT